MLIAFNIADILNHRSSIEELLASLVSSSFPRLPLSLPLSFLPLSLTGLYILYNFPPATTPFIGTDYGVIDRCMLEETPRGSKETVWKRCPRCSRTRTDLINVIIIRERERKKMGTRGLIRARQSSEKKEVERGRERENLRSTFGGWMLRISSFPFFFFFFFVCNASLATTEETAPTVTASDFDIWTIASRCNFKGREEGARGRQSERTR